MDIELNKKELEIIYFFLDCPYNSSETYKSCKECEYSEPDKKEYCKIDTLTWKIYRALNRKDNV